MNICSKCGKYPNGILGCTCPAIVPNTKCKWLSLSTTEEELCADESSNALEAVRNACQRLYEKNSSTFVDKSWLQ